MKKFDPFKEPEPELFFTSIEAGKREYVIRIYDISDFERKMDNSRVAYIIFKAKLLEGFEEMYLNKELMFRIHFPESAFNIAWQQADGYKKLDRKSLYDCVLKFKRDTKKKMTIISREFDEITAKVKGKLL